ncbi:hypothetical protein [Actinoplanes sp. M2I2]|uniref:hypothetical protein n=1 Tax=Actinoplanes sp. M2I2 TaxID=1734444 RepID=UPI0020219FFD|nr:hypothetical protein [Actinoplanes sp. M2I2]
MTPEACTLPTADRSLRLAEFDDLFTTSLREQTRLSPTTLRWQFRADAEKIARDLAVRESSCCSFFSFTFTPYGDRLEVDVRVPEAHVAVLDALAGRATARLTT